MGFCSSARCPVRALKIHPTVIRGLLIPPIREMQEAAPALAPGHCGARRSRAALVPHSSLEFLLGLLQDSFWG